MTNVQRRCRITSKLCQVALVLMAVPSAAFAHVEVGTADGFVAGYLHPLTGLDHLVAMVAVGLWGAQLGAPAIWLLPIVFPIIMALGGAIGVAGLALPVPDLFVALSAVVLGGAVLLRIRAPLAVTAALVGVFAVFHGYTHGVGLRGAANALAYGVGFVVATGMLHGAGIAIGALHRWRGGAVLVRTVGLSIAAIGCDFVLATVMAL